MYNEEAIFKAWLEEANGPYGQHAALTPIPGHLKAEWIEDQYYVDPLMDGSSLLWIEVIQETLKDFSDLHWLVDDPGTLYPGKMPSQDFDEPPVPVETVTEWLQQALANYTSLFNRLEAAGVPVVNEED